MKTNPTYSYARICQENIDDIPRDLRRGFEKFPSDGFICECRAKVGLKTHYHRKWVNCIIRHSGGGVDKMQNKAWLSQPGLQLPAGA